MKMTLVSSTTKALLLFFCSSTVVRAQNLACSKDLLDDIDFLFYNDRNKEKPCKWLTAKDADKRKSKYCGLGHVMGACRSSCEYCICQNDEDFKFPKIKNPNELRPCAWIDKSPDNTEKRRQKYCYEEERGPGDTWIASDIGNKCVKSCGFCVEGTQTECRPDNKSFTFKLDTGKEKKCEWITKNESKLQKRFDKYCYRGHVRGACGSSCRFCTCEDNIDFRFVTNQGKQVECNWLTKKDESTNARRWKYCYENKDPQVASEIGNQCVSSCGFCSESTESDDSVAPSPQVCYVESKNVNFSPYLCVPTRYKFLF